MAITFRNIMIQAAKIIVQYVRDEEITQGHVLTRTLDRSFKHSVEKVGGEYELSITAEGYVSFLENGMPKQSASFSQFPFLQRYFLRRGLSQREANQAAYLTIKRWMIEGAPTEGSRDYSYSGIRTDAVARATLEADPAVDTHLGQYFDNLFDDKTETI